MVIRPRSLRHSLDRLLGSPGNPELPGCDHSRHSRQSSREGSSGIGDISGVSSIGVLFALEWEDEDALIRAARAQTALIERDRLGGVCPNRRDREFTHF